MSATIAALAALVARHLPPPNPLLPAVLTTDTGLVNGTPGVLVRVGDATRPATYLPPLAIRQGNVFVTRTGAALTSPLVVLATNGQVPLAPDAGAASGSVLGVGVVAGAAVAATGGDWAEAMTSLVVRRGALLPLILGRASR